MRVAVLSAAGVVGRLKRFQVRMQVQMLSSKLGGESAELRELLKRIDGLPIGEQLVRQLLR